MQSQQALLARYEMIQELVAAALRAHQRSAASLTCIAVSKQQPIEAIACLYHAGHRDFGENDPLALVEKASALHKQCPHLRWHLIGHLQRNKLGKVAPWIHMVHSVDRESVLATLQRHRAQYPHLGPLPYCLQVNLRAEPQKSGVLVDDLQQLLACTPNYPDVTCCGLMIVPPQQEDPAEAFAQMAKLLQQCQAMSGGHALRHLSMGMSRDFVAAIAAGATMIRIGSAMFGARGE